MEPVVWEIESIQKTYENCNITYVVEESFYQGAANKIHLRFMGVLDYFFPTMDHISPMTVKAKLGVSKQRADKNLPKKAQKEFLKTKVKEAVISRLDLGEAAHVQWECDDVVDAVAIGLAYVGR
jgi:hypothetical protein